MIKRKPTRKVSPTSKTQWDVEHQVMLSTVSIWALSPDQSPITETVPAFNTLMTSIQSNLATVSTLRAIARSPITGWAAQKKAAKESLIAFSVNVMHAAYSYAVNAGNSLLADQTNISASALESAKYTVMLERIQAAIADITPFASDSSLTSYNVTSATITAWQTLKDAATITLTTPESAVANRESINLSIQRLLHDSMVALTNLGDTLVYQFRDANLDYFNAYWGNRRLHEHHVPTQARIFVVNTLGAPVTEGEIFIIGTPASGTLDNTGYSFIAPIPFGNHQLSITTPHFEGVFGPFDFKKGHSLTLHLQIDQTQQQVAPKVTVTDEEIPAPVTK